MFFYYTSLMNKLGTFIRIKIKSQYFKKVTIPLLKMPRFSLIQIAVFHRLLNL